MNFHCNYRPTGKQLLPVVTVSGRFTVDREYVPFPKIYSQKTAKAARPSL